MGKNICPCFRKDLRTAGSMCMKNEGSAGGAYSWGVYSCHPYVLLNFHGTLNDVFTLAHEMGHSIHTWYSNKNQSYTYSGYKIFVAEVASTCNEALLIRHLLKNSKDKTGESLPVKFISWKASEEHCSVRPCLQNLNRKPMKWQQQEKV